MVNKELYQYINDKNEFEDILTFLKFGSCIKLGSYTGVYDNDGVSVGDSIHILTNLTCINLPCSTWTDEEDITYHNISKLTNLRILICNDNISNDGLTFLTDLTYLNILNNNIITDTGIKHLTKLFTLSHDSDVKPLINIDGIKFLPNIDKSGWNNYYNF